MAIITLTVGTASRNYSTWQTAEDSLPADVVASGNSYVLEGYKDSEFTGAAPILTVAGSTTDATHTITIKCGAGQSFYDHVNKLTNALRYNASNGVGIRATSGNLADTVTVTSQYVTLDGIQVCTDHGSSTANISATGANFVFKNVIGQCTASNGNGAGAFNLTAAGQATNCLAVQETTGAGGRGFTVDASIIVTNCIAVRTQNVNRPAFDNGYGAPTIRNCLSLGFASFTRGSSYPLNSSSDYNATDLAAGTYMGAGTHQVTGLTASATVESMTAGAVDARAKAGAGTINAGFRDNTYTADLDIVKQARSTTTPTIGAWEYVASGTTVTFDGVVPSEWQATMRRDAPAPSEWLALRQRDNAAPVEWLATMQRDGAAPVESGASVQCNGGMVLEFSASVNANATTPAEWSGSIVVALDSNAPIEFRSTFTRDDLARAEWLAALTKDAAQPVEWLATQRRDIAAPADWQASIRADGVAPAEWSGGIAVTATSSIPIEFGAVTATDARCALDWRCAVLVEGSVHIEFNRGLVVDQKSAADWLRTIFGDAVVPGAVLVVFTRNETIPVEFGGASAFVPGNTEIFRVDARGRIWRVDARSTIWAPSHR